MICENIALVRENIRRATEKAGRNADSVTLVCVTKGRPPEEIKEAIRSGLCDIGENKVQEALAKYNALRKAQIKWHLVGHLQTNKVRAAVEIFDLIHSVDSLKLAQEIDRQALKINKVQDVLIEVNTSGEASKFGVRPEETPGLIKEATGLKNIRLQGLMTIAPIAEDKELARPYFKKLRELKDEINKFLLTTYDLKLTTLSMGMSQDYEVAVEEGSTMVRIGTAIFKGEKR